MRSWFALGSVLLFVIACSSGGGAGGGAGGSGGACGGLAGCFDICVCSTGDASQCSQACQGNQCSAPTCGGCQGCSATCLCTNAGDQALCQQACGGGGSSGSSGSGGSGGGGPACDDGSGWDAQWQSFECQVLELTNQRRAAGASCGGQSYPPVAPLGAHPLLTQTARAHAKDMGDNDFFSHTNLQGLGSADRIEGAGYTGSPVGENIAAGQASPESVVDGWMNSEGHCKNIMNDGYVSLGVGYYVAPDSYYERYWVQNFGGD